ncbi:hypothetical protein MMC08_003994 [Hypocenomyce scalaris]|nr:hypothetical protein [Hypocenomyce scalaris]
MAEQVLRLFPSASLRRDGPGRIRYSGRPPSEPEFEMVKPHSDGKGIESAAVVISITEASPTGFIHNIIQEPPRAYLVDEHSRAISPSPSNIELPPSPSDSRAETPALTEGSPHLQTSSTTLDRDAGASPTSVHSPVMRSMFPRFDPTIPLHQQRYYPTAERGPSPIPSAATARPEYAPAMYSPTGRTPTAESGYNQFESPRTPTATYPLPPAMAEAQPEISTPSDLLSLWSLANGQGLDSTTSTYVLQLECTSLTPQTETIHLLTSFGTPLYTLTASPTTHTITRTHPTAAHPTALTISTPTLLALGPTQPLIASIFPTLAELMALDQSSSVAVTYKLDRATSGELQAEALVRAQLRESSNLFWDSDSAKYYLVHPTLDAGEASTLEIGVEHAARTGQLLRISILAPPTSSSSAPPSPPSTPPPPLLTLSLPTLTLTLHGPLIAALPSLFTLDTLLSALLTLLLHLHRRCSSAPHPPTTTTTTTTMTFAPPLTTTTTTASLSSPKSRTRSRSRPRRRRKSTAHHDPSHGDLESGIGIGMGLGGGTMMTVIPPFEPAFAADDARLPAATRAALRVLYWAFAGLVWVLGVGVNVVAAGVVGVGMVVRRL